jgi:hypothetical protein
MDALSQLLSIIVFGLLLMFAVLFLAGNLAYFIRIMFTFRDPRLHWDPSAGLPYYWRMPNAPNLNASDWAERAFE